MPEQQDPPKRIDDPTIPGDELLWRRILPEWLHEENGAMRPASLAFVDRLTFELSVHLGSIADLGRVLRDRPQDSVAAFPASAPRELGLAVVRDPEDDDPSHALVCPSPNHKQAK